MDIKSKKSVTEFFVVDKPAFGSYDNIRKIPNYIDGLKISQRKLIWTAFEKCDKEFVKTETFANLTVLLTNYVHCSSSLCSVTTSLVQNFPGSNNYQYLLGNSGGFGCRMLPVASAPRYTRVKLSPLTKELFNVVDSETLQKQYFEGSYIEPKYLIPIFPTIFLNSSAGISTGFASTIYSRNPTEIISYIDYKLNGGLDSTKFKLLPWFKNHLGKVEYNEKLNKNESFGVIKRNNTTKFTITELPVGVEYQKYISFLNSLCENGTIQDYEDRCDPKVDVILIIIKTTREFSKTVDGDERKLYEIFRLIHALPETLCCIDENNKVREFSSIYEILDSFIEIRLKQYIVRKNHLLSTMKIKLETMISKFIFVKGIVDNTIQVSNKSKNDIITQLKSNKNIIKMDDSYDYLLRISISSLTSEMLDELKKEILRLKLEYNTIKATDVKTIWENDLNSLKKFI